MSLHVHHLRGCAPVPLAYYLKALGILRLVAEQQDAEARGFWQDEHFCLLTRLDADALERFFLEQYAPTPFVSPWNKGSGFFAADEALKTLERSSASRFEAFRRGIAASRKPLTKLAEADAVVRALKARTKAKKGMKQAEIAAAKALKQDPAFKSELATADRQFSTLKADLFGPCDFGWRGAHRAWLDAAVVLADQGKPSFPALLGTGGNDGRLDLTNNAMQRIVELFDVKADGGPRAIARRLLKNALFGELVQGSGSNAIGQFLPGHAGGANATTGPDGSSHTNAWDFVLMLEGAVLFSARTTRRLDPAATSRASAPFAVRSHTIGHGSPGGEKADRGEQWMPLWPRPCSLGELTSMLGEARLQLKRQVAQRPLDVARALSSLGVARGINAFTRFGYLERNGQSNLAVPLGRVLVQARPQARLVDDLGQWLDRLQRLARDANAPAKLVYVERRLADAVYAALTHESSPERWQSVLLAASDVEALEASGTAFRAGPLPPLSPAWLSLADDDSAAWRLACALGSAAEVRHHWLPLKPGARRFLETDKRLGSDPRVVMSGRDGLTDCTAIVQRRLVEAARAGQRCLPIEAAPGYEALPADLAELVAGRVDLGRVMALARALMAIRWERSRSKTRRAEHRRTPRHDDSFPDEAWLALRLACLPWPLSGERAIPADAAMVRRLMAGDGTSAVDLACRRLSASGVRPPLHAAITDPSTSQRWAAALVFPISKPTARAMMRRFDNAYQQETR